MVKKFLAMAVIVPLLIVFGGTEFVTAADCPPHGTYVERPIVITNPVRTYHMITVGYEGEIPIIEQCIVSSQGYVVETYCKKCGTVIGTYSYEVVNHTNKKCPEH